MFLETQPCIFLRIDDLVPANFMTLVALQSRTASDNKNQPCSDVFKGDGGILRQTFLGYVVLMSQSTFTQIRCRWVTESKGLSTHMPFPIDQNIILQHTTVLEVLTGSYWKEELVNL